MMLIGMTLMSSSAFGAGVIGLIWQRHAAKLHYT